MLCVLSVFVDESGYGVSMPVSQERMMNSGRKLSTKELIRNNNTDEWQ